MHSGSPISTSQVEQCGRVSGVGTCGHLRFRAQLINLRAPPSRSSGRNVRALTYKREYGPLTPPSHVNELSLPLVVGCCDHRTDSETARKELKTSYITHWDLSCRIISRTICPHSSHASLSRFRHATTTSKCASRPT